MKKNHIFLSVMLILSIFLFHTTAYADTGQDISYLMQGTGKVIGSVFAIPKAMFQDTCNTMFPFGLVTGAIRGTVQTVTGLLGGTFDLARGAAPYAKYAALAL